MPVLKIKINGEWVDISSAATNEDETLKEIVAGENISITETSSEIIINATGGITSDAEINGGIW